MSTKRKQRGRERPGSRPAGLRRPPPKTKQKNKKKTQSHSTVFWIQYLVIVDHTMRFIFKAAFCFMLPAQDSVSTVSGGHVCACVYRGKV